MEHGGGSPPRGPSGTRLSGRRRQRDRPGDSVRHLGRVQTGRGRVPLGARSAHEPGEVPLVSVVLPALNEADNLPHVFARLPAEVAEVILVDGNSTDETVAVARRLRDDVVVVEQPGAGKGDALRAGCAAATGDIIVTLDADGSTDPAEIPRFVAALTTGGDVAKGTRYVAGGGSNDITLVRSMGNRGLARLVNVLFGTRYSDLCYGYNAFWRRHLDRISLDCDGFEIETLLNIRARQAQLRVVEVPSYERPRQHGTSNLRAYRDGWRILRTIVRERRSLRSAGHRRPSRVTGR